MYIKWGCSQVSFTLILMLLLVGRGNTTKPGNQPNWPGIPPLPCLVIQFIVKWDWNIIASLFYMKVFKIKFPIMIICNASTQHLYSMSKRYRNTYSKILYKLFKEKKHSQIRWAIKHPRQEYKLKTPMRKLWQKQLLISIIL